MYHIMNRSLSLYDHCGIGQQLIYWAGILVLGFLLQGVVQATCTANNPNPNVLEDTPTSSFTDNADGTVTHSLTGLTWDRCTWGKTWDGTRYCNGSALTHTWAAALEAAISANSSSHLGQSDWRLPSQRELLSIVETCGSIPAINLDIFPPVMRSRYVSASYRTYGYGPSYIWGVDFEYGRFFVANGGYVRLVRGGQPLDAFDLLDLTTTTTSLATSPVSPTTYGESVTLTATVTGDSPTGTIQFKDGGTNLICDGGDQTLAAGGATCVIDAFDVGSHIFSGSYPGDVGNRASYSADVDHEVAKKVLTVTGLSAANKVYDGNTDAAIDGTGSLIGIIAGDTVTLVGSASGVFASPNVGSAIAVVISDLSLIGADASNYTLTLPTTTADITPAVQVITGFAVGTNIGLVGETASLSVEQAGQSTSPVVFSSSTETICQVGTGGLLFLDPGQCDVHVNQDGDANYYAAEEQNQSLRVVISGCGDMDEDGIPDDIDATPHSKNFNECLTTNGILYGTVGADSQVLCADESLAQGADDVVVEARAVASFIAPEVMLNAGFTAKTRSIVIINNKSSCSP